MPGAIVIGASSGIGAALARSLSKRGYRVGLAARRVDLLEQLRAELPIRLSSKPSISPNLNRPWPPCASSRPMWAT